MENKHPAIGMSLNEVLEPRYISPDLIEVAHHVLVTAISISHKKGRVQLSAMSDKGTKTIHLSILALKEEYR